MSVIYFFFAKTILCPIFYLQNESVNSVNIFEKVSISWGLNVGQVSEGSIIYEVLFFWKYHILRVLIFIIFLLSVHIICIHVSLDIFSVRGTYRFGDPKQACYREF